MSQCQNRSPASLLIAGVLHQQMCPCALWLQLPQVGVTLASTGWVTLASTGWGDIGFNRLGDFGFHRFGNFSFHRLGDLSLLSFSDSVFFTVECVSNFDQRWVRPEEGLHSQFSQIYAER